MPMNNLLKRLAFSAVFVSISVYTIFWAPKWLFIFVVEAFALVAFFEFLQICDRKGVVIPRPMGLGLACLIPVAASYGAEPIILVFAVMISFAIGFDSAKTEKAFGMASMLLLGLVYVVWFFSHLVKLRMLPAGGGWVFFCILVAKAGDAIAYFVGSEWGKHRLIEHISPKKSVEGAWAELIGCVVLAVVSKVFLHHVPVFHLFLLGLCIGVIAQVGDLLESLMKRDVGIKDSGTIPGLGGILDILDSLLLTIPFVYYYIILFIK